MMIKQVNLFMFIDWCAKLYRHGVYVDLIDELATSGYVALDEFNKNDVSSLKINTGCTFKAFHNDNQEDLLFTTPSDIERLGPLGYNDQMTGYSCSCNATIL